MLLKGGALRGGFHVLKSVLIVIPMFAYSHCEWGAASPRQVGGVPPPYTPWHILFF